VELGGGKVYVGDVGTVVEVSAPELLKAEVDES
jgi:hypothetical protein